MEFDSIPNLYLGTSSWSAESWVGPFYLPGTRPADFLPFYATQFRTVEIDSTYYRIPSRKTVQGWQDRTPPGFIFAARCFANFGKRPETTPEEPNITAVRRTHLLRAVNVLIYEVLCLAEG